MILETLEVIISNDGVSAVDANNSARKFKIQEIMLGAGSHRKAIPYTKMFLSAGVECKAEILKNGRLRII